MGIIFKREDPIFAGSKAVFRRFLSIPGEPVKLPGAEKIRIIPLPQYFIDAYRYRIRKV